MRQPKVRRAGLMVTPDAIKEFGRLSVSKRLDWLDEMRDFLSGLKPLRKNVIDKKK